jgi:menaquinone-9 beta-reductase
VLLLEKEAYPFHKVCGEYISLESWDFLERLGVPLGEMNLPIINNLKVSAPNGNILEQKLPLGGFGISRFLLDNTLFTIAKATGVNVMENTKADDITFEANHFSIKTAKAIYTSKICCGSFGKKSNFDVKWKRSFINNNKGKNGNYIGIKYHAKTSVANNEIWLHNFKDGYCGMSQIEDGKSCICYLTTASNLKAANNSIEKMQEKILYANPHLKNYLQNAEMLYEKPLAISQISFSKKASVENHVLMLGDAAGLIAPLCGNGMSMAMHSSKIAAGLIEQYLKNEINRQQLETQYTNLWKKQFANRLFMGRTIQQLFGKKSVTNLLIGTLKKLPRFTNFLIKQTHGKPF